MSTVTTETQVAPSRTDATEVEDGEKSVPFAEFKHVKDDLHRYKEEARKSAEALKAEQERKLRENEQWKELAAAREKEANEYKTKYETVTKSITERAKLSKVREEALKLGLVDTAIDDLELMDLKDVVVETTSTGRVNVHGAKSAAERIKSIRPHWFSGQAPIVNGGSPQVVKDGGGEVTWEELNKLEAAAQKSGDYKEYQKALMSFKQKK